jgi:hypothetical protein
VSFGFESNNIWRGQAAPLFIPRGFTDDENNDQDDQDYGYYAHPDAGFEDATDHGTSLKGEQGDKQKRVDPFGC